MAMTAPAAGNAAMAATSRTPACMGRGQKLMAACTATINAHGTAEAPTPFMHQGQCRDPAR